MRTKRADLVAGPGSHILDRIQHSDDVVRWIGATGQLGADGSIIITGGNTPPTVQNGISTHLKSATSTYLARMTVIVDSTRIGGVGYRQLADYLAFVTLAQINPSDPPSSVETVLSLFPLNKDATTAPPGLTAFDKAYLAGLYDSSPNDHGSGQRATINRAVRQALTTDHPNP